MTLREKLIKIEAKVVSHAKAVTFQMAEVVVPRTLVAALLDRSAVGDPWDGLSDRWAWDDKRR